MPKAETLAGYWRFGGVGETLGSLNRLVVVGIDALMVSQLARLIWLNILVKQNWLGGISLALLTAYASIALAKPQRRNHWRISLIAASAYILALVIPVRADQHELVMSFLALFAFVCLFVAHGTRIANVTFVTYSVAVCYLLFLSGGARAAPGYVIPVFAVLIGVALVTSLLLYHFMVVTAQQHTELRAARSSLEQLGSLGHIGYYRWDHNESHWEVNDVLRGLLQLPEERYPEVSVDLAFSRVPEAFRDGLRQRLMGAEDNDFNHLELELPDGSTQPITAGSKVFRHDDGHTVRYGFMWATGETLSPGER
jgi:hypothetical protein